MSSIRSAEQAEKIGTRAGRTAADMLRIEIVAAVYLRCLDSLDENCQPPKPFDGFYGEELRKGAGEFATDLERAFNDGLRGRCCEIIERLNRSHTARLPEEESTFDLNDLCQQ